MEHTLRVIDTKAGLSTAMGNASLYKELLMRFRHHQKDFKARLEEMMQSTNAKDAIRCTHSLKGLAGNIGAKALQLCASKLEYALAKGGTPEQITATKSQTLNALQSVLDELDAMDLEPPLRTPTLLVAEEHSDALYKTLKRELKESDAHACDTLRALLQLELPESLHVKMESVSALVFDYHFEEALQQLSHLENTINIKKGISMNTTLWNNPIPKQRYRVLVIDDLGDNIALISNILKEEYDITVATSALLGIELAKKEPKADLILLDIVMPMMDGYEVCAHLKANPLTHDIPIIFLTILDETADVAKGFSVGGVDYVTKPFEPSILKARVKTHCELFHQKTELKRFNHSLEMVIEERTKELEQTQLYVERLAKQAALGDVIGMIAHQWKQPVAIIAMIANNVLLDIALDKLDADETQKEMENISKQTQYLSQTIDNFRNFFKPNQEKQSMSAHSFFDSLGGLMKAVLGHHAIELLIDTHDVATLNVHKNELLQVIVNLVNNAKDTIVEHHVKQGIIQIKVYSQGNNVIIDVIDNGGGIPMEVIEKLAEPYFTTKGAEEGTGLGLYMSRMITQKHLEGTLAWFNQGAGACFRITIPQ